jgi:hypothetical protein
MNPTSKVLALVVPVLVVAMFTESAVSQPNERRDTVLSLRLTDSLVFACTDEGLYRSRLDKKQWERLRGETVPEPGGLFVGDLPDNKTHLYFVTSAARGTAALNVNGKANTEVRRPGLYRSTDDGETWELLSNAHDFGQIVQLPGGRLFALAGPAGLVKDDRPRQIVLVSETGGREWKDITNGIGDNYPCLYLVRDPDHPRQVCVYSAFTMRRGGTVLQAADDQFVWKDVHTSLRADEDWPPLDKKTEKEFFDRAWYPGYRLSWPAGVVPRLPEEFPGHSFESSTGISSVGAPNARLDNYFTLPFRSNTTIPAFDVVPEKPAYEFKLQQPQAVNATLTNYGGGAVVRLVDAKSAKNFWSLKVWGPDGLKKELTPKDKVNPFDELKPGQKIADVLKTHDAWQFSLTPDKPARRSIDLRDLGMPEHPGTYRVQLCYQCSWCDDEGIHRRLNTVGGQLFTVKIEPASK